MSATMICFGGYPLLPIDGEVDPNHQVLLRLDEIVSVAPRHDGRGCDVEMSTGYRYSIAMKAEDFARNFLSMLADFAKRTDRGPLIIPPPTTPRAA